MRKIIFTAGLCLATILLQSCSSPFAGPDAFDLGLANAMQYHAQAALGPRGVAAAPALAPLPPVPPLAASPPPRKAAMKPKTRVAAAASVKRYPEEPNEDGKFLPLPVEGPLTPLAEPQSLGGGKP